MRKIILVLVILVSLLLAGCGKEEVEGGTKFIKREFGKIRVEIPEEWEDYEFEEVDRYSSGSIFCILSEEDVQLIYSRDPEVFDKVVFCVTYIYREYYSELREDYLKTEPEVLEQTEILAENEGGLFTWIASDPEDPVERRIAKSFEIVDHKKTKEGLEIYVDKYDRFTFECPFSCFVTEEYEDDKEIKAFTNPETGLVELIVILAPKHNYEDEADFIKNVNEWIFSDVDSYEERDRKEITISGLDAIEFTATSFYDGLEEAQTIRVLESKDTYYYVLQSIPEEGNRLIYEHIKDTFRILS